MDFGFNIPTRGPLANTASVLAIARKGEELGFRYFAVPDHIVVANTIGSVYPYSKDGSFPGSATGESMEQLTVMAYLAAVTTKARLLTSVMVVPHRNPVLTAKILATIDVLSGGRVTVGCGAGWMAEEFKAIGTEPFEQRGKVTDEYLRVFRELWTQDDPTFDGAYASFSDVTFLPKPVQRPHPPLWIGGESKPAMRRAARLGDAWYPIGNNPRFPLDTLDRFKAALGTLEQLCEEHDRDPAQLDRAYWANWYQEDRRVTLDDGRRHLLTGSAEEVAGDVRALGELGVRHCLFAFQRPTLQASLDSMERFARDVMPLVAG